MRDYDIPERHLCDITRGKKEAIHDSLNERENADLLAANRLIGVRRSELANIRVRDIEEREDSIVIHTKGKGGKNNVQVITDEKEREQIKQMCEGKKHDEYLLDRKRILNCDADFHSQRAERAKEVYARVVADMQTNAEKREEYRNYIVRVLIENGMRIPHNIDKPYYCRGSFREMLIREGKPYIYDRLAAMYVSLTVTNHWRVDVTIQHYLSK